MRKLCLMLSAAGILISGFAGEIELARRGRTPEYSVVTDAGDPAAARAAEVLRKYIRQAAGVELPLRHSGSGAVIRIQSVKSGWADGEYRIQAENGTVSVTGAELSGSGISGTLRGVLALLEEYAGLAVYGPGETYAGIPETDRIAVPDDLKLRNVPAVLFNCTAPGPRDVGMLYEHAGNCFACPWFSAGGGHTHHMAIPKKYYQSNPEWFALVNGRRMPPHALNWHSQYCYSAKEVRERIYRETRQRLKSPQCRMVEVGQNDGFVPCQCAECRKTTPQNQLWKLNIDIAERLFKEFPDRKICVLAYDVTLSPPDWLKELPPNVMVNLAPCTPDALKAWARVKVPAGFSAYLYNWGWYQYEGFMPKLPVKKLRGQAELFRKHQVRGIYRCGFGELFGLEGPGYYLWGKFLADPEADADLLLERYCRAAFGNAAPVMKQFYLVLDEALGYDVPRSDDWYRAELLDNRTPALLEPVRLMLLRYPESRLSRLEILLAQAEQLNPESALIRLARTEFDYLKLTVSVSRAFAAFRSTLSEKDWQTLLDVMEKRLAFIRTLPTEKNRQGQLCLARRDGLPLFGQATVRELEEGGRLLGRFRAPCSWDPALWRKRFRPAGRELRADGSSQQLLQRDFYSPNPKIFQDPCFVSVTGKPGYFTVVFRNPGLSGRTLDNTEFAVYFGDGRSRIRLQGKAGTGQMRVYERVRTNAENRGRGDVYRERRGAAARILRSGNEIRIAVEPGKWDVSGTVLDFNAARLPHYIWEYNLDQVVSGNYYDHCGKLRLK